VMFARVDDSERSAEGVSASEVHTWTGCPLHRRVAVDAAHDFQQELSRSRGSFGQRRGEASSGSGR
jgi:hypothetical protein